MLYLLDLVRRGEDETALEVIDDIGDGVGAPYQVRVTNGQPSLRTTARSGQPETFCKPEAELAKAKRRADTG